MSCRLRQRFCDPADGESDPLARQSLEDSAFQGGALERGAGPVAISEKCLKKYFFVMLYAVVNAGHNVLDCRSWIPS